MPAPPKLALPKTFFWHLDGIIFFLINLLIYRSQNVVDQLNSLKMMMKFSVCKKKNLPTYLSYPFESGWGTPNRIFLSLALQVKISGNSYKILDLLQ